MFSGVLSFAAKFDQSHEINSCGRQFDNFGDNVLSCCTILNKVDYLR